MIGIATAAISMFVLLASPAFAAGTIRLVFGVAGQTLDDITSKSNAVKITRNGSNSKGAWDAYLEGRAYDSGQVGAKAFVSGTLAENAQVTAKSSPGYFLEPPDGVNYAGGKLIVYAAVTGGDIRGNASLDLSLDVNAHWSSWVATGSAHRTIGPQPGTEEVEMDIVVTLPATLDSTTGAFVDFNMVADANASTAPSGGKAETAIVDALNAGKITGFRILNASGVQLPGFTLTGSGGSIPERAAPPAGFAIAIEYYNKAFAHFFITTNAVEIAKLDSGAIAGWQRTGQSFKVYATPGPGLAAVCRFFSASFAPKSSHFYAPRGLGCDAVFTNPAWQYEGDVFYSPLPSPGGACPDGNIPVYRLYNNGQGGAPNHRFTTSEATRLDMLSDGYSGEGPGVGVGMCSPK
jgi:Repeat of unknown function (DUF5648)